MVSKIFKGRTPYIYDAESIISVRETESGFKTGGTLMFDFDKVKKRLHIYDTYQTESERIFGKDYIVKYVEDKQKRRDEKIKIILNEELS